MARHGYSCLVDYLDNFLIFCETKEHALLFLIGLLRRLGFGISWAKVVEPTQRLVCFFFGGGEHFAKHYTVHYGLGCWEAWWAAGQLHHFHTRKRATKRQLQSLAGLLNWACQAIRGGRFFLHPILDLLLKLKRGKHMATLSAEFQLDMNWWITYLHAFNGLVYYVRQPKYILHAYVLSVKRYSTWWMEQPILLRDTHRFAISCLYGGSWSLLQWSLAICMWFGNTIGLGQIPCTLTTKRCWLLCVLPRYEHLGGLTALFTSTLTVGG